METIADLKKKELEIRNKINSVTEAREKELLPKYRKEWIGKCFKYRNSCSGDKPKWWLYVRILDVESVNFHNNEEPMFKILQMENPPYNHVEISIKEFSYVRTGKYGAYIPITVEEYNKGKAQIMAKVKEFLK